MPGLLQFQAELRKKGDPLSTTSKHPEDMVLWLPSNIPAAERQRVCFSKLPEIEEMLCTAQCHNALARSGSWEEELRVLANEDICGYQDPDHICKCVGRRGVLEDGQLDSQADDTLPTTETHDFTLFTEERECRDGTGETRRTLSWIWWTPTHVDSPDNAKVLLLQEEMRRTLEYLTWKAKWWVLQARLCQVDDELSEGLAAYAHSQSELQTALHDRF
ncbi:hypothetical protein NLJ89_g9854 [Agrocybe chaxingu]|uniref:Uncharacterized protein n=1 Tax=Agrocybe chaxingu TaxID=84603 RepID=A0A9W8JS95_9AGAR|nr:hypothetical protein NLJ89_g9854 [Agrocybe chaxingu]